MHQDVGDEATSTVSGAYTAARELLEGAEGDAARIRHEADRYLQRREQEAELLVAKARRVLASAEDKAAVILSRARETAMTMLAAAESAGSSSSVAAARAAVAASSAPEEPISVIDLVAAEVPEVVTAPAWRAEGFNPDDTGLDRILASAISNAVQRAFPTDR